jgi:hypothetical protein
MTGEKGGSDPEQLVLRRKQRVQRVRDRIWADGVDGERPVETKRQLAMAAISYWDVLRDYRDEPVIDNDDYPDMSPIYNRIGKTTEVIAESPGWDRGSKVETVPAIAEIGAGELINITEQLDDVATALGFSADVEAGLGGSK